MANTNELKRLAEPAVRASLAVAYGKPIEDAELPLPLRSGGEHRFDVVSKDRTLIAGVKTTRIRANGKMASGPVKSLYTEILFLHLADAETKLLVLTDHDVFRCFTRESRGKVPADVTIVHVPLPDAVATRIRLVHEAASLEIVKRSAPPVPVRPSVADGP